MKTKKLKIDKKTVTKLNQDEAAKIDGGIGFTIPRTLPDTGDLLTADCFKTMNCFQTLDCGGITTFTAPDLTAL